MRLRNVILAAAFGMGILFATDQKASACWCCGCGYYAPYYGCGYSYAPAYYYHPVVYAQPAAAPHQAPATPAVPSTQSAAPAHSLRHQHAGGERSLCLPDDLLLPGDVLLHPLLLLPLVRLWLWLRLWLRLELGLLLVVTADLAATVSVSRGPRPGDGAKGCGPHLSGCGGRWRNTDRLDGRPRSWRVPTMRVIQEIFEVGVHLDPSPDLASTSPPAPRPRKRWPRRLEFVGTPCNWLRRDHPPLTKAGS